MSYKLLASDIDGTLLRRDGTIHPDDAAAIRDLQASGIPVTIITGRLYSGSCAIAREVGIVGPIACVDGSHIVDVTSDEVRFYRSLSGAHAAALRGVLERYESASFLFAHDSIVHDATGEAFAPYVRTWSTKIEVVERVITHSHWDHELGLMAVVSIGTEANILSAVAELRERLADVAVVLSFPVTRLPGVHAMIVRAKGPTKGTAVEWLAAHHGCTAAEVVVVGDWLNDVPMFDAAGRSFAMGQAPAEVKSHASDLLDASGLVGGGVAEAIRKIWG
ncbi:MAG: HAD hydrolase family protein [Byssovorax sp.]